MDHSRPRLRTQTGPRPGRLRPGIGSIAAFAFMLCGIGCGACAYFAQIEPEAELITALPLARI